MVKIIYKWQNGLEDELEINIGTGTGYSLSKKREREKKKRERTCKNRCPLNAWCGIDCERFTWIPFLINRQNIIYWLNLGKIHVIIYSNTSVPVSCLLYKCALTHFWNQPLSSGVQPPNPPILPSPSTVLSHSLFHTPTLYIPPYPPPVYVLWVYYNTFYNIFPLISLLF